MKTLGCAGLFCWWGARGFPTVSWAVMFDTLTLFVGMLALGFMAVAFIIAALKGGATHGKK